MRFLMLNLLFFCLPLFSIGYLTLCYAESDAKPRTRMPKLLNSSDIIRIKSLALDTVLQLSPDREYLAYTVANPERKSISLPRTTGASSFLPTGASKNHYNSEIWVTHLSTRESHILTSDVGAIGHHNGHPMDAMSLFTPIGPEHRNSGFGTGSKINSGELAKNRSVRYTVLKCRCGHQTGNI